MIGLPIFEDRILVLKRFAIHLLVEQSKIDRAATKKAQAILDGVLWKLGFRGNEAFLLSPKHEGCITNILSCCYFENDSSVSAVSKIS